MCGESERGAVAAVCRCDRGEFAAGLNRDGDDYSVHPVTIGRRRLADCGAVLGLDGPVA